jgi:hypothetical protein
MDKKKRKHDDTTLSLHPMTFDEAIKELATPRKVKAVDSDNTSSSDHQPDSST